MAISMGGMVICPLLGSDHVRDTCRKAVVESMSWASMVISNDGNDHATGDWALSAKIGGAEIC